MVKHIFDTSFVDFVFRNCFHKNESHSISLENVIIFQMHIVWSDYLIHVKCGPMQSHVLGGFRIYDPLARAFEMCFITNV